VIDEALRRGSEELADALHMLVGPGRILTLANGLEDETRQRLASIRTQLNEAWPADGDVWTSVGPDRMLSFLETAPLYRDFRSHYDHYWRTLAAYPLDDALEARARAVILDLLDSGFSASLDLAVRVAARLWMGGLRAEVESRAVPDDVVVAAARDRFVWLVQRQRGEALPAPVPPRPGEAHEEVTTALRELDSALRAHPSGGEYPFTFNEAATAEQIETLRSEIAPFPLPSSLEAWLRFADGGGWHFWPGNQLGPTLRATDFIDHRMMALDLEHPPGLLPIGYASHSWLMIELVSHREPAVFYCPFGEDPQAVAPSLAAYFDAATACAEGGFFARFLEQGPWFDDPVRLEFAGIWQRATARHGWRYAPGAPEVWMNRLDYPLEWSEPLDG
jgi:hypothetical protein